MDIEKKQMISVIIPTYNREGLLPRAISSVLSQTFQNFEIIVVDDASQDETKKIIKEMDDERIIYIRHEKNMGGSAARNTGIKNAKGDFIAFLDSDDEYLPQRLEATLKALISASNDTGVVYSNIWVIDGIKEKKQLLKTGKSGFISDEIFENNCCHLNTALVKKECFETDIFDELFPRHQDWELWIRVSNKWKFVYIDQVLANWYCDTKRQRINTDYGNIIKANNLFMEKYSDKLINFPLLKASFLYANANNLIKSGKIKGGRKLLKHALKLNPFNIKYYLSYILSLLGSNVYGKIAIIKNIIKI